MSTIGRIVVILNLVLSACFLGWASNALSSVQSYKTQLADATTKHQTEIDAKQAEISALNAEKTGLANDQRTFREERDQARANVDEKTSQLEELKRANDKMQANLTEIQAALTDYNATIAQLTQQKDAALERAHEAERARDEAVSKADAAEMAKRDAEEATKTAQLSIGDLEKERTSLQDRLSKLDTQMKMLQANPDLANVRDAVAMPKIDASVLRVEEDMKFVVLNKGKNDGVEVGFTFDVYRGSQYKGQVRISEVQDVMSSGQIIFLNDGKSIATGDSATTSL